MFRCLTQSARLSQRIMAPSSSKKLYSTTAILSSSKKPPTVTPDFANKTEIDIEKELFRLKRQMTGFYSKGLYGSALECALVLETQVKIEMGTKNAVYASCLNNIALMHKMMGNNTDAMDSYTEALHIYEDITGKENVSYAATLANLGALYKVTAGTAKGMEKLQLLERAEEALFDARALRTQLLGSASREAIYSSIHLSSVWNVRGKEKEAEDLLLESLATATKEFGHMDVIVATILNNLGLMQKSNKRFQEATESYAEALKIRSEILGEDHPETIVSMHNTAELLLAQGQVGAASTLQEKIVNLVDPEATNTLVDANNTEGVASTHADSMSGAIPVNDEKLTVAPSTMPSSTPSPETSSASSSSSMVQHHFNNTNDKKTKVTKLASAECTESETDTETERAATSASGPLKYSSINNTQAPSPEDSSAEEISKILRVAERQSSKADTEWSPPM